MTASRLVALPAPGETPTAAEIGGKGHNLARLAAIPGVKVPPWFAIRPEAFAQMTGDLVDPRDTERTREDIRSLALPDALRAELLDALRALAMMGTSVAVRSSATTEDGAAASFAGQFTTVLGIEAREDLVSLWDAICTVWLSAFSAHARAYAAGHHADRVRMAVLVQAMAPARAAGVAFSLDPVTGERDVAIVSAVYGLGESLVSGDSDADTFRVHFANGTPTVRRQVADKDRALVPDGSGTRTMDVPEVLRRAPSITDAQATEIARVVRALESALGAPQDVEWAIVGADSTGVHPPSPEDTLHILQTRPVTAIASPPEGVRSGERRIWDNSNIVESYGGVTTPLTFSFARGVYEQVYRQFCDVLGVGAREIDAHRDVFANMLGLMRGRVYYNLLNWYRVLALLPGYAVNREFMERMMGVRERVADPPPPPRAAERWRDGGRVARMAWRLWREHRRMDREVVAFHARVARALAPMRAADLDAATADELVAHYRRLEGQLLNHWRAPLVNDFFAMIWFGVLGKLVERWLPGAQPTLVNDLLVGEGGIISTEPARRLAALARLVEGSPALGALFTMEPDDTRLLDSIGTDDTFGEFRAALQQYLDEFGDRCVGELKLETVTYGENPGFIVGTLRSYIGEGSLLAADSGHENAVRLQAEEHVRSRLSALRERVFFGVLRRTRTRIRDRENLRFERTRVFGTVRRIFRALGARLHDAGRLDEPRDVFYLTVDEIFGAVAGTAVSLDLATIARERRKEFARFETEPSPPERFETIGLPDAPPPASLDDVAQTTDELQGLGCCPGIVRAPVRVVRDPSRAGDLRGHILVAERTDPGWTLLFPTASGLLVQRGSLLSHSAIVAREIGLPCIVAIPNVMDTLQDGDWVEMDGTTGIVRRVASPPASPARPAPAGAAASPDTTAA